MVELNQRIQGFDLSPTLKANETVTRIRESGKPILHMGFGESPFPIPERLKNVLAEHTFRKSYISTQGLPSLREQAKSYWCQKFNLDPDHFTAFISPGSKLSLYALQMAIEGDLILPVPSWVSYAPQAKILGTEVIKQPAIIDENGLSIDPDSLVHTIATARKNGLNPTKIILNYPSNPTGLTIGAGNLKAIAEVCLQHNIFIIADEIYALVQFDNNHRSIAEFAPEITAITTALSKHMSLGGWRLGVSLIPKKVKGLQACLSTIASETWSCVCEPIQYAAIDAFSGDADIEKHIQDCTTIHAFVNRYLATRIQKTGIRLMNPQGGFYHYPDFTEYEQALKTQGIKTSSDLADHLLNHYGLVSLPGHAFGEEEDVKKLRLSGCDYDGQAVLNATQSGTEMNEEFLLKYAPHIPKQADVFDDFMSKLAD